MGFLSGLGGILKKAAPLAAFIPGVGPVAAGLIAAGAGAAGGAMQGRGLSGSIMDGMLSGAGAGVGRAAAGLKGFAGNAARVGGNLLTDLMNPDTMDQMSRGVGAIGKTQAHNRGVELDAMMEADQMRIVNDRDRRDDESHMMKGIRAANYIQGGGMQKQPRVGSTGRIIPSFRSPLPVSEDEKRAATTLEQQLMQRLQNPAKLRDYDSKMKPGTMENISNYGAPIMGVLGSIFRNRQQRQNGVTMDPITLETPDSIFTPNTSAKPQFNYSFTQDEEENPYSIQAPRSIFTQ